MFVKFMLFFAFSSALLAANEENKFLNGFDPINDELSDKYQAGKYLIYDCKSGHWVCVLEAQWKSCYADIEKEEEEKPEYLSCFPFEELPNKKSCLQKQLFVVTQNFGNNLCSGKSWVQKNIRL